ncbi:36049_t:CDS:1, partial [Gigaspora margarita]
QLTELNSLAKESILSRHSYQASMQLLIANLDTFIKLYNINSQLDTFW